MFCPGWQKTDGIWGVLHLDFSASLLHEWDRDNELANFRNWLPVGWSVGWLVELPSEVVWLVYRLVGQLRLSLNSVRAVLADKPSTFESRIGRIDWLIGVKDFNPFTAKSDHFQISSAASPEILHQTVWRTWLFISLLRWKMIILPILTTSLIHFSSKGWEQVPFWSWEWMVTTGPWTKSGQLFSSSFPAWYCASAFFFNLSVCLFSSKSWKPPVICWTHGTRNPGEQSKRLPFFIVRTK